MGFVKVVDLLDYGELSKYKQIFMDSEGILLTEKFRMKKDGVILVLIVVVVVDDFSAEPFTIGVTQRIYIYIYSKSSQKLNRPEKLKLLWIYLQVGKI